MKKLLSEDLSLRLLRIFLGSSGWKCFVWGYILSYWLCHQFLTISLLYVSNYWTIFTLTHLFFWQKYRRIPTVTQAFVYLDIAKMSHINVSCSRCNLSAENWTENVNEFIQLLAPDSWTLIFIIWECHCSCFCSLFHPAVVVNPWRSGPFKYPK